MQNNVYLRKKHELSGDTLKMTADDMIANGVTYVNQKLCHTSLETCQKPHTVLTHAIGKLVAVRNSLNFCKQSRAEAEVILD